MGDGAKGRRTGWVIGALVLAAGGVTASVLWWTSAPPATDAADPRAAAVERALHRGLEKGLREAESRPPRPRKEGVPVAELSAEQLSGIIHRSVEAGLRGEVDPGDAVSPADLAGLPLPPFSGSTLKSFNWLPHWPRPRAYMLWVEGPGDFEEVVAHYLAAVRRLDPEATVQRVQPTLARIESDRASANVRVTLYEDGRTVSVQLDYGGTTPR